MNPESDQHLKAYNEAIFQRGMFIQMYSAIEFALVDLVTLTRDHPSYNAFGDLPLTWGKRLERFHKVVGSEGPIKQFESELKSIIIEFENFEEKRNFLAHGIMHVIIENNERPIIEFRMYRHKKSENFDKKELHLGTYSISLNDFRVFVENLRTLTTRFLSFTALISREVPLSRRPL